jgi:hypothetical protein
MSDDTNIVEFISRADWEKNLSVKANEGDLAKPVSLPRELNRRRVVSAFMDAFELVGGTPRLVEWANENYTDFVKLYARLLPSQSSESLPDNQRKELIMVLPKTALDE